MPALWVYKNNRKSPQEGDWDEFFDKARPGRTLTWGDTVFQSPAARNAALSMEDGDLVLCWQSDDRAAVGLLEYVKRPSDLRVEHGQADRALRFAVLQQFAEPVKLLDLRATRPALAKVRAFQQGRIQTIVPTDPAEARAILRACGLPAGLATPAKAPGASTRHRAFGEAEQNAAVEAAAVEAVCDRYRGWARRSRERDKVGYDYEFTKGRQVRHVEIKGRSSDVLEFVMTRLEWETAQSDSRFFLCLVTNALDPDRRRLHEWSGEELVAKATKRPISYQVSVASR